MPSQIRPRQLNIAVGDPQNTRLYVRFGRADQAQIMGRDQDRFAHLVQLNQQMQQALAEGADVVELRLDLLSEAAAETPEGVVSAAQLEQLLAQRPSQIETIVTYRSVAN